MSSTIPPGFMQELRDRLTLSDVVGRKVKLTRAGREFKGCCPFHDEKTPSFYVNDDKQFFHCFGCGAHSDVIGFVMRDGNLSFTEAIESLAALAGLQVPQASSQDIQAAEKDKDLYSLLDETTKWFGARLRDASHRDALTYIRERGVSDELLSSFRIGFAPADGQALPKFLKGKGYTDAQMIEAGVTRPSTRGGEPYSFFRDRVIFPVCDRRGRIVAFGGRVLPEHLRPTAPNEAKPPKYINSADTPLFHKGRMLFGEPHARQAAADGQSLIVVEGYLDVMACFGAGYRGALAPLGTALTEEQVLALWKMIPGEQKTPILCFDGDDAGRRAAGNACERILPLLQPDHSVRLAFLPDGEDPDTLIKNQGKGAFDAVIAAAMPLVEFLWRKHTAGRSFDTPEERAGLAQALDRDALKISNPAVQQYYRDWFREKVSTKFKSGSRTRGAGSGRPTRPTAAGVVLREPTLAHAQLPGQILLACILNQPAVFREVAEQFEQIEVPDLRFSALKVAVIEALRAQPGLAVGELHARLQSEGFGRELGFLQSDAIYTHVGFARPDTPVDSVQKGWDDIVTRLERKSLQKELKAVAQGVAKK